MSAPPDPAYGAGMHRIRSSRPLLAALLLATVAGVLGVTPAPVLGKAPAACTVGDTLTRYRKPSDWYRSVLDTELRLRASYAPTDLVAVSRAGLAGGGQIRRIALDDLTAMAGRRRPPARRSRSSRRTAATTPRSRRSGGWVAKAGYDAALLASARPGHSEHQLGTALDLKSPGGPAPWTSRRLGRRRGPAGGSPGTPGSTAGS